jgi:Family of unknown function (DUF5678)
MADEPAQESERSLTEVLAEQVRAERRLSHRLADFKGRWVAVRDHEVVADANSLDELVELVDENQIEFVVEVPEERAPAAFF